MLLPEHVAVRKSAGLFHISHCALEPAESSNDVKGAFAGEASRIVVVDNMEAQHYK